MEQQVLGFGTSKDVLVIQNTRTQSRRDSTRKCLRKEIPSAPMREWDGFACEYEYE